MTPWRSLTRLAKPALARVVVSLPEPSLSSPGDKSWSDSDRRRISRRGANDGGPAMLRTPPRLAALHFGSQAMCPDRIDRIGRQHSRSHTAQLPTVLPMM